MSAKRWILTAILSALIAWVFLYVFTYFGAPFVREAGGQLVVR